MIVVKGLEQRQMQKGSDYVMRSNVNDKRLEVCVKRMQSYAVGRKSGEPTS